MANMLNGPMVSFFFFFLARCETVHFVRRPLFGLLYQPQIADDECGAVGGTTGRENRSTPRKRAKAPLCLPQSHMT
jgi:hypothetical protein